MKTALTLGKVCAACGKERKSKVLRYDPNTFQPYCDNPYICTPDHPNSAANIIARQKELLMIDFATANDAYKSQLLDSFDPSVVDQIQRLLNYPLTMRIQDPEMAQFMVEYKEEHDFDSMSEVIRYAVQMLMENKGVYLKEHTKLKDEKEKVERTEAAIAEIEQPKPAEPEHNQAPKKDDDDLTF